MVQASGICMPKNPAFTKPVFLSVRNLDQQNLYKSQVHVFGYPMYVIWILRHDCIILDMYSLGQRKVRWIFVLAFWTVE